MCGPLKTGPFARSRKTNFWIFPVEVFGSGPNITLRGTLKRARITITTTYPRNSGSPIEGFVVIAEYLPGEGVYEVTANFQGPLAMQPVMAMALDVPANRLRLKTPPDSGGSFGVKHAVFPYIVLMAIAARKAGRPVKSVEERSEHLVAATSATNRVTTLSAAVSDDGIVTALDWDQFEDCGAYLRAPEPATLYRMHGNMALHLGHDRSPERRAAAAPRRACRGDRPCRAKPLWPSRAYSGRDAALSYDGNSLAIGAGAGRRRVRLSAALRCGGGVAADRPRAGDQPLSRPDALP